MEKTHRIYELLSKAQEKIGDLNFWEKIALIVDASWEKYRYGTAREDYFQYEFYKKNNRGRREFITHGRSAEIHAICNDPEKSKIFVDKDKFAEVFRAYIGRDIIDMHAASFEEFQYFCRVHERAFQKPRGGTYGRGVGVIELHHVEDEERLFYTLKKEDVLLEEVIVQHDSLAAFNPTSLNSMRVVTIVGADGIPQIMPGAVLRIGRKGKVADNFHHNGIAAQIDIRTGIVCSAGIDKEGNRYVMHPDAELPIIGFAIPAWDEVRQTVLEAAKVVPEVRFVGWDVAVTREGKAILIEGNNRADPDVGQMSDGIGKWPEYKAELEKIREMKCGAK